MSSIPFNDLKQDQKDFLLDVKEKINKINQMKAELVDEINSRTDWKDGDMKDLPGEINYDPLGINHYGWSSSADTDVLVEDFWYASDQNC